MGKKKVTVKILNSNPWNKKVFEGKVYQSDGQTIKWDIMVFQDAENIFSVEEDTKSTSLNCLTHGKTFKKAMKKFMRKEDELYQKKLKGETYFL